MKKVKITQRQDVKIRIKRTIEKNGGIDLFDYRMMFGKAADINIFYETIKELKQNGLLTSTDKLPDGQKIPFTRYVKTSKWDNKPKILLREKKVCFVTVPLAIHETYKDFVEKLKLPTTTKKVGIIHVTKGNKIYHRVGVSRGFVKFFEELEIPCPACKHPVRIPESVLRTEIQTRPQEYTSAKKELAKQLGVQAIELKSRGHKPPKIEAIEVRTTKDKAGKIQLKVINMCTKAGILVHNPTVCHLTCESWQHYI